MFFFWILQIYVREKFVNKFTRPTVLIKILNVELQNNIFDLDQKLEFQNFFQSNKNGIQILKKLLKFKNLWFSLNGLHLLFIIVFQKRLKLFQLTNMYIKSATSKFSKRSVV